MTAIGKIFAIINLLFSLVVAGLIVMVYARSTNWAAAYKQWEDKARASDASRAAITKELDEERVASAGQVAKKDEAIKALEVKLAAAEKDTKEKAAALAEFKNSQTGGDASLLALQAELNKRKDEVAGLEKQLKEKDNAIAAHITDKNKAVTDKVASEIRADNFQAKAERMEQRLKEAEIALTKQSRSVGFPGGTTLVTAVSNPPPQSVDGVVTATLGDLIHVSIGSDAGLEKGHTLDVYRLKPTPLYLGQIRLNDVHAKEAVGVPVDKLKAPARKGDLVASDVNSRK